MPAPCCLYYAPQKVDGKNNLYFGDNLKILRDYVEEASVDMIYLDPPFNSSATYNVLFKEKSGEESAAQITAFEASVAPLYERRLLPEEAPAVIDRRYSRQAGGGVQGNRHQRPAQDRRAVVKLVAQDSLLNLAALAFQETIVKCRKSEKRDLRDPFYSTCC